MKTKYPKLPKRFKEKWLKALRSGEYKQGQSELYNGEDKYCCLGVACDVAGHGKSLKQHGHFGSISMTKFKNVPEMIKGRCNNDDHIEKLTNMNDGWNLKRPRSFKQIANWIERNL